MTQRASRQLLTHLKPLTANRPLVLMVIVAVGFAGVQAASAAKDPTPPSVAYQQRLRSEVDTANGAPVSGRNPAAQKQTSLAAAAAQPDDIGKRVAKPAAAVVGTTRHVQPSQVIPDVKKTGMLVSGCLAAYGVPGADCITARTAPAAGNQAAACDYSPGMSLQGIQVDGSDPLHAAEAAKGTADCNVHDLMSSSNLNLSATR